MSLLTICQNAADEIGVDRPSSIIGHTDPAINKLERYANRVGNELMKRVAWQVLRKETTFTATATETQSSVLPADFDRFVPETFWNRSGYQLLTGPISATEWQGLKAHSYQGDPKFIHRGGSVLVIPTLTAGDSMAFEYVSNQWCESSGGTGQAAWAADTDVGVLDEELITRGLKFVFLTDEGLPNEFALAQFNDYFNLLIDNDQPNAGVIPAADIFGGRHFTGEPPVTGNNNINNL